MKLYRGIIASDLKQAHKYIKSTNGTGASDFGPGVYFTTSLEEAKTYGNYIFSFNIDISNLRQTRLTNYKTTKKFFKDNFNGLNCQLVTFLDLGINARYTFTPTTMKHYEETGLIR